MTYTIPDFGPSDLLTSSRYKYRRIRVDAMCGLSFALRGYLAYHLHS